MRSDHSTTNFKTEREKSFECPSMPFLLSNLSSVMNFLKTLHRHLYLGRVVQDSKWGNFVTELWPFVDVKILFLFSILRTSE